MFESIDRVWLARQAGIPSSWIPIYPSIMYTVWIRMCFIPPEEYEIDYRVLSRNENHHYLPSIHTEFLLLCPAYAK